MNYVANYVKKLRNLNTKLCELRGKLREKKLRNLNTKLRELRGKLRENFVKKHQIYVKKH